MGRRIAAVAPAAALGVIAVLAAAPVALAHGVASMPAPTLGSFLLDWQFDPSVWLPAIVAVALWEAGVRTVNRAHPDHPVTRSRTAAWVAGVAAVVVALDSGIGFYDTALFSDHMVQHLLLTVVAPPLLLLAGPVTLLLQASPRRDRQRWILPILHSRVVRVLGHPAVAWLLFAGFMWGSHFSPLFEASLENDAIHELEHALFLATALLFWWPVVGRNPSPWRLGPAASVLYVALQMPQMAFLALAIFMAPEPLYPYYSAAVRPWGPSPLADQQLAGGIMWVGGDVAFMVAMIALMAVWMREEERRAARDDRRHDAALALAGGGQPSAGTGAARYSR